MAEYRKHKIPLTGFRIPEGIKAELKATSEKFKIPMNDIVISAIKDKLKEIKKHKPII